MRLERKYPPPPGNLHEYQKKGLTKFAFRKLLVLKGAILVAYGSKVRNGRTEKEKTGASSRITNAVIYKAKYSLIPRKVKEKLQEILDFGPRSGNPL